MFKKLIVWCLLLMYFGTANGMAVNLHFCGKRLAKVQVNSDAVESCCPVKDEADDKCCHNRQLNIKIKDGHQSAAATDLPKVKIIQLLGLAEKVNLTSHITLLSANAWVIVHDPPAATIPIGIKNCVFRI